MTGEIKGIGDTPIQFRYIQTGINKIDTVVAKGDRFRYVAQKPDDGMFDIFIKNPAWRGVWFEAGNLTVSGNIDKPEQLKIKGTKENDLLTAYNQTKWAYRQKAIGQSAEVVEKLNEEQKLKTWAFMKLNTPSVTSMYLLNGLTKDPSLTIEDLDTAFHEFPPQIRESYFGKKAEERIEIIKNQPVRGKRAPDFKLVSSKGDSVQLSQHLGKYVLLDFWGHWCGPCIRSMPELRAFREKYKGEVTMIGIGAEWGEDKETWLKTIEKHQANWIHLTDFQFDRGEVMKAYNISEFPTYFLIDQKGVVVARENNFRAIEKIVTETKVFR
ncbi:TlpA disulfide reductase family protein [Dyadobacter chenhuakuii]|uniref:AhpC/TSA family protein n=1 Tax=Dyadobacter chenhuakuii TaxID=2909339 RepID=A0ABY5E8M1_9BACT|nr:TlpA disulfide reductase family protein [Dyadobacter chenhuakuii]UTM21809.1 AhpC/TSA family protein [Dyadobacter chenhuakuii]